ncbi:hypothetical protein C8Q76DRAFT_744156 [Earliella scabrosa]|nr:hypothetical protein C8Q76DRAFT_744156 [Earliella scabrosa]
MIFDIDGTPLYFDKTQVPNVPMINYSDDLPRLFREWHKSNTLVVNGRGIPVKDWERFYKKRSGIKEHAWELVRVKWGNWKFLVMERERFPTEDAFWAKYSDAEGHRLGYQKILDHLQEERIAAYAYDAAAALWFFNEDLTSPDTYGYFIYKKTGKVEVCKQTQTVAERWHKLLADKPDVAQRWERVRGAFKGPPPRRGK